MQEDKDDTSLPDGSGPTRRTRYRGTHPRHYHQKYKEHNPQAYPDMADVVRSRGGTPAGTHVPVLLAEVLGVLAPATGECVADATVGYGGHAEAMLQRIGPTGRLVGLDIDAAQLQRTRQRLEQAGGHVSLLHSNFAGLGKALATAGLDGFDIILADLGISSMQVDDADRGFSYKHDGPLDMRMDLRRTTTAGDLVANLSADELTAALRDLADEPQAQRIAQAIVGQREKRPILRTQELADVVLHGVGMTRQQWREHAKHNPGQLHPAARTFQALRMLVNDELASLRHLLRIAPSCLRTGGRIAIISFHSGEDRLVANAFAEGLVQGQYAAVSETAIRPTSKERYNNPRSRSAMLRWARRR